MKVKNHIVKKVLLLSRLAEGTDDETVRQRRRLRIHIIKNISLLSRSAKGIDGVTDGVKVRER